MSHETIGRDLILGQVAERFHLPTWKIGRLFERKLLPPPRRVGRYRVVNEAELPAVEAAARQAGYLPPGEPRRDSDDEINLHRGGS